MVNGFASRQLESHEVLPPTKYHSHSHNSPKNANKKTLHPSKGRKVYFPWYHLHLQANLYTQKYV